MVSPYTTFFKDGAFLTKHSLFYGRIGQVFEQNIALSRLALRGTSSNECTVKLLHKMVIFKSLSIFISYNV